MDVHEIQSFAGDLVEIEDFCVYIAAHRRLINAYGLRRAFRYENAEGALERLKEFPEHLASAKRTIANIDKQIGTEVAAIEQSSNLVEQVGLLGLQLRMTASRYKSRVTFFDVLGVIPYLGKASGPELIGESQVSIQKIIIGLQRLRGALLSFHSYYSKGNWGDNDLFKPSQVSPDRIVYLIESATETIQNSVTISIEQKTIISNYLNEAKAEVVSKYPSWSKVVGILMIAAALTSGIADAKNAAENIRSAARYIMQSSLVQSVLSNDAPRLEFDASEHVGTAA